MIPRSKSRHFSRWLRFARPRFALALVAAASGLGLGGCDNLDTQMCCRCNYTCVETIQGRERSTPYAWDFIVLADETCESACLEAATGCIGEREGWSYASYLCPEGPENPNDFPDHD